MAVITMRAEKEFTMEDLQAIVRAGKAKETFGDSAQIGIIFDGSVVQYDVIGYDAEELVDEDLKHSMTIQAHTLTEERPFDTKDRYGRSVWETSDIREYLNSDEFTERYDDLVPYLAKVKKKNNSGEDTEDLFFLLSVEEFDPEETPYEYYKAPGRRAKRDEDGDFDWHWTRSAYRGGSYTAWCVYSSGYVGGDGGAIYAVRCAPACVIA